MMDKIIINNHSIIEYNLDNTKFFESYNSSFADFFLVKDQIVSYQIILRKKKSRWHTISSLRNKIQQK